MTDETVTNTTTETNGDVKTWKRRGLLAAAWAAVAAIVAKQTTQPMEAADGDPVLIGAVNSGFGTTTVRSSVNPGTALVGDATAIQHATGVAGFSAAIDGAGVAGTATEGSGPNFGVYGVSGSSNGTGTLGFANSMSGSTVGVRGENYSPAGFAVYGRNVFGGTAVLGEVPGSTSANGIAVYGLNYSTYAGAGPGAGGFGVYGLSAKGHGLVGATAAAGAGAIVGASNGVGGAYAGLFYGPVVVGGSFAVTGTKSAAVPHPDGSRRLLYCMESPESWFEDFGKGQLACGQADVTIDPDFAAVANMDDYHVFVTPYGRRDIFLSVTEHTPSGFRVEAQDQTAIGRFSWRVVAKRKDIVGERLAKVTIPPEPILPTEPPMREAPTPPAIRSRMVRQ